MIRLAANVTLLDWGLPLLDRAAEARRRGFEGVECLFPYAASPAAWTKALDAAGVPIVLINTPVLDWDAGGRGCAALPGQQSLFETRFAKARDYARQIGCVRVHVMSGNTSDTHAFDVLVNNLRRAARSAPDLTLLIEPLNPHDMPGYFLDDFDLAIEVLHAVDRPNVALQFDAWHALHTDGDPLAVWHKHHRHVRHVQIAGWSDRAAPDLTNADEAGLLQAIGNSGYDGWISAEYRTAASAPTDWLNHARTLLT